MNKLGRREVAELERAAADRVAFGAAAELAQRQQGEEVKVGCAGRATGAW